MHPMKFIFVIALLAIVGSLGAALYYMMQDGRDGKAKTSNMAKALTVRIALSVAVFLAILVAWKLGYLQPTGVPAGR